MIITDRLVWTVRYTRFRGHDARPVTRREILHVASAAEAPLCDRPNQRSCAYGMPRGG